MTRIIKASEVKPGMTIRWETGGITHECEVEAVTPSLASGAVDLDAVGDGFMRIERATLVTVLSEPQPEEPTAFGAKVVVAGRRMIRCTGDPKELWAWRGEELNGDPVLWSWGQLTGLGPVTVVPDQGWAAPDDTPEVPERIEEWPKDDTALRPYLWRDPDGDIWRCVDGWWRWGRGPWEDYHKPFGGPWDRVTDA